MKTSIRCMSVSELESVSSRVERTGMIKLCLIQRTNHIFCPSLSFKIIVYELMFMSIKLCLPPHSFFVDASVSQSEVSQQLDHFQSLTFYFRGSNSICLAQSNGFDPRQVNISLYDLSKMSPKCQEGFFNLMILDEKLVLNPDGSHGLKRNLVILSVSLIRLS